MLMELRMGPRTASDGDSPATRAEVVAACCRGDRAALDAVFRAEAPVLERLIVRLVGPHADVEDLLQSTLMAAVRAFPSYRGEASVRTWLARIAVRITFNHLKRPERRRRVSLELVSSDGEPVDRAPMPDRHAHDRRILARIYQHLESVDVNKRVAFTLHVIDGRPIWEVAALMSASETATKSRVFFARRALLAKLRRDPMVRDFIAPPEQNGAEP
jgi:RNA polymerase sigma-70 factor (ECF subfamily)